MNPYTRAILLSSLAVVLVILIVLLQRRVVRRSGETGGPPALAVAVSVMGAGAAVLAIGMFRGSELVTSLGIEVAGAGLTTVILEWIIRPVQLEREIGAETTAIRADQRALLDEIRQLRATVENIQRAVE